MSKLVLFQGDSITDCHRSRDNDVYKGHGYATMVAGELSMRAPYAYRFCNRGVSGDRIVDVYARIRMDAINLKPDFMSILIGVNDVWHEYTRQNGVDAEKFEMVYGLLIEEVQRECPGIKIMILEPFVLPGSATENTDEHPLRWDYFEKEVSLRAQAAKRVAEKYDLIFVPLQERFNTANIGAPSNNYWLSDGVHPTAAGHTLIKQAWVDGFEKLK